MPILKSQKEKVFLQKTSFAISHIAGVHPGTLTLTTLISNMCLCTAVHLGVRNTFQCHILRISVSQKFQTRDKESSEPRLTSWSLLLKRLMPQLQLRTKQHSVPLSKNWFCEGIPQISADQLRSQGFLNARHLLKKGLCKSLNERVFERSLPTQIDVEIK